MKVKFSTISFLLLLLIHLHGSYADDANQTDKYNCGRLCSWLKEPDNFNIKRMLGAPLHYESCKKNGGDQDHLDCIKSCNPQYSEKRLECFEDCGFGIGEDSNHECYDKCNSIQATRFDFSATSRECMGNCIQNFRKRFRDFYTCLGNKTKNQCAMSSNNYSTVLPMENEICKEGWRSCFLLYAYIQFYGCFHDKHEVGIICENASYKSPSQMELFGQCNSIKPKESEKSEDCRDDASWYRHLTKYACEELFLKKYLELHENCHDKCPK